MKKNVREENRQIFEDTMQYCAHHRTVKNAIRQSISAQKVMKEGEEIPFPAGKRGEETKILVSPQRTLEAAAAYKDKKVCVLNFASATNPGGGVTRGTSAQEESLCRISTLYSCLTERRVREDFYEKHREQLLSGEMSRCYNDDAIYTPGVLVIKSDTTNPAILPEEEWFFVDVITCAAPNLRLQEGEEPADVLPTPEELKQIHQKRAKRILEIARAKEVQVLILGAFGCGVFQNSPELVAASFHEALREYEGALETVEFAIYAKDEESENLRIFRHEFA